jgi:hypothetical protein
VERVVPVLSEACSRSGVLWARGLLKAQVQQTGCNGEHAVSVHRLLGEEDASVNLVAEGGYESEEDEEWWVGTVRIEGEEEEEKEATLEEVDESEPEREIRHRTSVFMRKDDSGLEDEFKYFWEVHNPSDPNEQEEDRWWSPGPPEPSSEEDEEEVRYLTEVLKLGPQGDKAKRSRKGGATSREEDQEKKAKEENNKRQGPPVGASTAGCLA